MTFFEQLKAHIGGLLRLNTDLYRHDTYSWDGIEGRVCLLLGVEKIVDTMIDDNTGFNPRRLGLNPRGVYTVSNMNTRFVIVVFLLIDGSHQQVWITEEATEIIK